MVRNVFKILFGLGLIVFAIWFLIEIHTIILYIVVSWIVALIGRPLFSFLDRFSIRGKHLPGAIKSLLTLSFIMGVLLFTVGVFIPLILDEAQRISRVDLVKVREAIHPGLESITAFGERYGIEALSQLQESELVNYIFDSINLTGIPTILNSTLGIFGNLLVAVFSVAFISFFFLKDKAMVSNLLMLLIPKSKEPNAIRIIANTRKTLSRYFLGLLLQVTAITLCVYIGLSIVGIKNAMLIAFFSGLANLVPYLGPWIGATFATFIVLSSNIGASFQDVIQPKMIGVLVVYAVTQMLDNYIFQPTIFSNTINAHPLEIFLVILIAGTLAGIFGMVVAIPLYAFLRIVFIELDREFEILARIRDY